MLNRFYIIKFLVAILPLCHIFVACNKSMQPCEYNITEIQATIDSIEPDKVNTDSIQVYKILMHFNGSSLSKKHQSLADLVPRLKGKTTAKFIERNKIRIGDIYTGTVSEIKNIKSKWTEVFDIKNDCQSIYVSFNYYFQTEFKE